MRLDDHPRGLSFYNNILISRNVPECSANPSSTWFQEKTTSGDHVEITDGSMQERFLTST